MTERPGLSSLDDDARDTAARTLHEFLNAMHSVDPNLNDTFHYAAADSETIALDGHDPDPEEDGPGNQDMLVDVWLRFGHAGLVAYVARLRGREPIEPLRTPLYQQAREYVSTWAYEPD